MAIPTRKSETGLGVLRRVNNNGKTVTLVSTKNGWVDKTFTDMAKAKGIRGDYYVFSFSERSLLTEVESKVGRKYKLQKPTAITAYGFRDWQRAQNKYIELANTNTKRRMKRWNVEKNYTDDKGDYD